ncbi:PRC-barrel domain-containing protein [Rhizobium halophytocola]|uniref:Sporulation protein YlmC with PRC-barrel domain n=1 Tax=Rhizobium halophytocola TaxID=735519 RepID=A0ABS4DXN2_9HYPH|nr:PRC-barrel domain-containing protein [Rhizobium halophytocola]MBP1850437.1 sporulation protein YlmC with PRC-barrel domain [Rhizobium halophytocola]
MRKTLKLIAAATLLGSTAMAPLAMAQDATTKAPAADTSAPAVQTPDAGATDGSMSKDSMSTDANSAVKPMAKNDAATSGTYLTEQSETQVSANEFIGSSVYNGKDESIGDINDLIITKDGQVAAAVIGVGGFLGMGEKNVALPLDKITISHEDGGDDVKLTTTETADALKSAPEFKTLDQQQAQKDTTAQQPDATTTSSTTGN